jgi:putative ABC transport system ATP-binding protein
MITHNPEAAAIASRILYMRDGKIVREEKGSRSEGAPAGNDSAAQVSTRAKV